MITKDSSTIKVIIGALGCWIITSSIWASVQVDGIYYDGNTISMTSIKKSASNDYVGVNFDKISNSMTNLDVDATCLSEDRLGASKKQVQNHELSTTSSNTYVITVTSHGDNGYTSYNSDVIRNTSIEYIVEEGSSLTITAHPDEGYRVAKIRTQRSGYISYTTDYLDDSSIEHSGGLSSIKEDGTIDVYFEEIPTVKPTYTITVNSHGDNGYTTYYSDIIRNTSKEYTVEEGSSFTITVHPDEGYRVAKIRTQRSGYISYTTDYIDDSSIEHSGGLSSIKENGTIDVYFEEIPTVKPTYIITVTSHGDNGYTTHNSDIIRNTSMEYSVEEGSSLSITAHPDEGYRVAKIRTQRSGYISYTTDYIDDSSIEHSGGLSRIKENGTIDVYFEQLPDQPVPTITFADINVKQVCINNWDTNGDGKFSYEEAAAVTDLGSAFRSNKNITSFNELQYFTGLTSIVSCAFLDCSSLTKITMPSSVTSIGYSAFERCKGLTELEIGRGVTFINYEAFKNCSNLTILTLPSRLKTIENEAFSGCTSITKIYANRTTAPTIQSSTFNGVDKTTCMVFVPEGCKSSYVNANNWKAFFNILESAVVASGSCGDNLTYTIYSDMTMVISGKGAMWNYSYSSHINEDYYQSIKRVIIEDGVTSISYDAFYYWTGLTTVSLPNSVTSISSYAFYGCKGLTSLTIPNSVSSISSYAFSGCTGLTSLTIPNSVTSIGSHAFEDCAGITSLTIGNSVSSIGDYAFCFCYGLTSLTIPSSLNSINGSAFGNCTELSSITVASGNTTYDSRDNCNAIIETSSNTLVVGCKNTIIPNNVTGIGWDAFYGCTGLTSVTIPSGVASIGRWAFDACTSLTSIIVDREVPPITGDNVFINFDKSACTLYVPAGCKKTYQAASQWCDFPNIVEMGTDVSSLDNAIYVEQTEGRIGGTMDIPVKLKNSYPVRGFQFTLELPEGATINSWALNTNRLPSGATLSDKIATQKIEGNKITVACSLNYGDATFTGNDGEIAIVNVSFGEDMEVGSYPIYLTTCDVTTASGVDEDLSDVKATLVLEDYVVGDANGDGKVRIGDATTILNYIVGTTSDKFNEKAADANGDGKIRIGDATTILNIIVNQ